MAANRIKGITVEIGGDTTKLSKALEGVNKNIRNTQGQLKDVEKLLKLDPTNTELLAQKQRLLSDAVKDTKDKLATLKTAAEQANAALSKGEISREQYDALQREIIETENDLKKLEQQASGTAGSVKKTGDSVKTAGDKVDESGEKFRETSEDIGEMSRQSDGLSDKLSALKVAMGNLAAHGIEKVIEASKKIAVESIKAGMAFSSQMSTVGAISGASAEEMESLSEKAKEMGATTSFSATESAKAFEYMAMAGWKTNDMLGGIAGIMDLAAASGEDLATTSDIVTDALTAFGMSAGESSHFADVLAVASSNANTNVALMGETFKYVAPVAGSMGYTAEDAAKAIGLMANSGIKASQAGTSLRSVITRLSTNAGSSKNELGALEVLTERLGVEFYNADGSARDFNSVLMESREAWKGLTDEEATYYAKKIAGQNAISGWLALMNASEADVNKLSAALENADGAAKKMAETRLDNLEGDITLFKSAVEGSQIAISDKLTPCIRGFVGKATNLVPKVTDKLLDITDTLMETGGYVYDKLVPTMVDIGKSIIPYIKSAFDTTIETVKKITPVVGNIWKGAKPIITAVMDVVGYTVKHIPLLLDDVLDFVDPLNIIHEKASLVSEEYIEMHENADKIKDKLKEIQESNSDIGKSVQDEYEEYDRLFQKLTTLVDENGKIKEHNEYAVRQIVEKLNPALGNSLEIVDGQVKGYKEISAQIDEIIAKKEAEAILDKGRESYEEAVEKRGESMRNRVKALSEIRDLEKELAEIENLQDQFDLTGEWLGDFDQSEAYGRWKTAKDSIEELSEAIDRETENIKGFNVEIDNYSNLEKSFYEGDLGSMKRNIQMYSSNIKTAANATTEELGKQLEEFSKYCDELLIARQNGDETVTEEIYNTNLRLRNIALEEFQKSKQMANQQGQDMPKEFAKGLDNSSSNAVDAANRLGDSVVGALGEIDPAPAAERTATLYGQALSENVRLILDNFLNSSGYNSRKLSVADLVKSTQNGVRPKMFAKGGIVNRATLGIIGESGKEAVIPLERNNAWIKNLADNITKAIKGTSGGNNAPAVNVFMDNIKISSDMDVKKIGYQMGLEVCRTIMSAGGV